MPLKQLPALALAILASATMLVLCMPLGEQPYLAFFAFVPLLKLLRGRGFLPALVASLASIFAAAWLSASGLLYARHDFLEGPAWVYTGFGIFGFSVCLAIAAWGDKDAAKLPAWWFAGLATLLEAFLLIQLPVHLALSQYRQPLMLQLAAFGGIWLVSFLLWWCNYWLATLKPISLIKAIVVIVPVAILTSHIQFPTPSKRATYGVIQVAEPDDQNMPAYLRSASIYQPDFVVWPELSGIPFTFGGSTKKLRQVSAQPHISPFITSFPDDHKPLTHNTSALFSNGHESAYYYKRKPFGSESKMHVAGSKAVAVPFKDGQVGLNICYDSCFPQVIRDTANLPGVDVIAIPSIDPHATNNFVSAIHGAFTPFRAAENGVSIIKADGYAYSMFVDPYGRIVEELPPGDRCATGELPLATHWTPYKQFGDWFLYLVGVAVAVRLGLAIKQQRDEKKAGGPTA